jgi:hypothetical protein
VGREKSLFSRVWRLLEKEGRFLRKKSRRGGGSTAPCFLFPLECAILYPMESINSYTSTKVLAKQGVAAIVGIAGGATLLTLGALPSFVGIAVGGIALLLGAGSLLSKDPEDKKAGAVLAAGGALAVISKAAVFPAAGALLGIGGIGFLAAGGWNLLKFLKGLKSRQ